MTLKLAGCIITDNQNRILLIHRNTADWNHWEIPGGKIENEEDSKRTAIREVKEETGVEVKITKLLGQKRFAEKDYKINYIWYKAKIISGQLKVMEPDKFDAVKYFPLHKMHKVTLSTGAQNFLAMLESGKISLEHI